MVIKTAHLLDGLDMRKDLKQFVSHVGLELRVALDSFTYKHQHIFSRRFVAV